MERNATDSSASAAVPTVSDLTTWSEQTETTEATSSMAKWVELREKCEPLLIIARNTTPFCTGMPLTLARLSKSGGKREK